ncbi:bifunctional SulP family inorganic anion transporter/carbonic anhydrase [Streptomyces griseorubiginosus]|uniref:bifunctional SulP family inorganic anion transporter/carbonic anhydrase n=1 Tax=Streptomyces griseorubiginosus TaxID=67304 RepID=UPI002E80B39A|nr:SulP family inorganic anion transporter [Streptomyces griseorubiginosus]WUB45351.1 SulP family inorganic anion transporter [Streptomyces griseorubiginosus]WUB53869.1 SulP family inorganic anion transporter [Streptomyces griseorubiginosus]
MSACVPTRATDPSDSHRASHVHPPHSPPTPPRRFRIAGADVSASIAVFLIALPLSLGIALATGAPLQAGLVAAAVGGIVAGRLGGCPLQVSGPAAGLTVVTADLIHRYGWRTTCAITVLAGVVQLGLGCLRVARTALAVSPAIVHGMLAGIGVTIAVAQLHIVLGGTPQSAVLDNLRGLPAQLARVQPAAVSVSALTLALLFLWPRIPGRTGQLLRRIPAALVAVAGATTAASLTGLTLPKVDLPSWSSHALAGLPEGPALGLVAAVLTTTLVCSVQSLLGAVAVDKLVAGRPDLLAAGPGARRGGRVGRSDLDRELLGQGAANIVSGTLGGLPVAGVAVRSSANVQAGAVSRNSTMLHGVLVVIAALLMVPVLEFIPLASLAALVMAVGIQMVSLNHIRTVTRHREVLVYAVTTLGVVLFGVLEGVTLGIAMAVGVSLHRLTRTRITHHEREGVHHVHVRGQLTFLAVPRLSRALHLVPQGSAAVVELDGSFMDHAAFESLQDWQKTHTAQGGSVELTGRSPGTRIAEPSGAADCRCRPWTAWRNHQCELPNAAAALTVGSAPTPAVPGAVSPGAPGETGGPDGGGGAGRAGGPSRASGTTPTGGTTAADAPTEAGGPSGAGGSTGARGPSGSAVPAAGAAAGSDAPTGPGTPDGLGGPSGPVGPGGPTGLPGSPGPGGHELARGISAFQRNTAPIVRGELARLAREGQQPTQLFLTCADSRLVTSMITSSGPGDLFVVRNVGNLVPLPGEESGDDSVAAAIEYAVDVLKVRSITVCGHSGCGAMQALLNSEPGGARTPLKRWLRHGLPSLERMADDSRSWVKLAGRAPADAVEQLCLTNVVQQLEHLSAHDSVARALREGELELHGMYFHVGEAQAYLLTGTDGDGLFDQVHAAADLPA